MRAHLIEITDGLPLPVRSARPRCPSFVGARGSAAEVLDGLRILVVGVGAIGRVVALALARLLPAELGILDPKRFSEASLHTQPIHPGEIGSYKAESTARLCKEISPATRVRFFNGTLQELSLLELIRYDVVMLMTDNLLAEVETGQRCQWLGKPLFQASVHGETMVCHVRSYGNESADSSCPACQYGGQEWDLLNRGVTFSCEGGPKEDGQPEVSTEPTMSTASLCGLAGNLAVNQLLRASFGLGRDPVKDTILEYGGMTNRTFVDELWRNPSCPCEHDRYNLKGVSRSLAHCSLVQLAKRAGIEAPRDILVEGRHWAERGVCEEGHEQFVGRLVESGREPVGVCVCCGKTLWCPPFFLHRRIAPHGFELSGHLPLRDLGAPDPEWILIRGDHGGTLLHNPLQHDDN